MEIVQTQRCYGGLADQPFVPPKGGVCFIHNLPPELLSRIFEFCFEGDDTESEEEKEIDSLDLLHDLNASGVFGQHTHDNDVKAREHLAEDEEGYGRGAGADKNNTHRSDDEVKRDLEKDEEGATRVAESDVASDATGSSGCLPAFQILVSRVCRRWRDVALSTPSIWTVLGVSPRAGLSCAPGLTLMERSKDLPVDICINCRLDEGEDAATAPSSDDLRFLLSVLMPHVHRWRIMTFGAAEYHLMYEFLSAASDPSISAASQLRVLELYHNCAMEQFGSVEHLGMSRRLTLFGGSAPLLTSLDLWGVPVDWDQPWIVSASNLKDMVLALHPEDVRPSWVQFATILRGAPGLEKLTLRLSGPSGNPMEWFIEPTPGSPADLNAPIPLLKLTDFTLAYQSQACVIQLLHKLHLPALKNLVLELDDDDYTDFVHQLARPATSLSPTRERTSSLLSQLESLEINELACAAECVEILYGDLQNLRKLDISLKSLSSLFLDILSTPCALVGRGNVWLPRLATLYVSGMSWHALRDVVQKRKDAGVPLSALYIGAPCEIQYSDVKSLMENVKTVKFFQED